MLELSIGDVSRRTGVAEGTLRMWEARHGFPHPERLASGHRRYSERHVELVRQVATRREAGVPLRNAIAQAVRDLQTPAQSLYATLRAGHPGLVPCRLSKRSMLALSWAIEDESLSRAERPLLFGSFQREHLYRQAADRWGELARGAGLTVAFADFPALCVPDHGPIEVPVQHDAPLGREWAIVCDAPRHAACLTGWEPPTSATAPVGERFFEAIWSVDPAVVRDAARTCAQIAAVSDSSLIDGVRARLGDAPTAPVTDQLVLATAITGRAFSYMSSDASA